MSASPRLMLVLMTTTLAACMAKHSEPPEEVAQPTFIPTSEAAAGEVTAAVTETSTLRDTRNGDDAAGAEEKPADEDRSVAVHEPMPAPEAEPMPSPDPAPVTTSVDQLSALGYLAEDAEYEEADELMAVADVPMMPQAQGSRERQTATRAPSRKDNASVASGRAAAMSGPVAAAPMGGDASNIAGGIIAPNLDANFAAPVDATSSTEEYTDHGVNGFTLVEQDKLSTFSIDVDTASYSVSRRKLTEGGLPPIAAVRVEEFVNYFDYGYTPPSVNAQHPFNVHFEAFPDPFRDGRHIMRVGVQAKEIPASERPPLHLTFLVDVSGSMSSADKLPLAQQSLHMLVDSLQEGDTVALATYAGRTAEILQPTDVTNKRQIHDAIGSLKSGGSTAMSSGLDIAYNMALRSFEEGAENRVLVLSDGDANVGSTGWEQMLSQIKDKADMGITMSTIGLGMGNYRDTLMEQLANKGDGNNFYIDSQQQAQRVFVENIGGTIFTVARDVKIQVEFHDDSVAAYRLIGYENRDIADRDFRNDRVDAGEIGSGHNVTALYEVILKEGYDDTLATVRLRYEAPGADKAATEAAFPFPDAALKETTGFAGDNSRIAYAAATFAEILRDSPNTGEMSLDQVIAFAQDAKRSGEKDDAELIDLMKKARRLGAGGGAGIAGR